MNFLKKMTYKYLIITLLCLIVSLPCIGISAKTTIPSSTKTEFLPSFPADSTQKKKEKKGKKKVSFETFGDSYNKAVAYYKKESWLSAARIFEELYPLSFGTAYGDSILFLFADCYFNNGDYELAAYHFRDYARRYPGTERSELAYYKCVKAIYNVTPEYNVDQTDTHLAIEEITLFIRQYPQTQYMDECNTMLDKLRDILARKDFEIVKLYYNTEHYKATQIAARNFLKDYSYSQYADDAVFILIKNNFDFACKSVDSKKKERFLACLDSFETLKAQFPDSEFLIDAQKIADNATQQIDKNL